MKRLRPTQLLQVPIRTLTQLKDDDMHLEFLEGDHKGKLLLVLSPII
jgi:hypothetical protein